MSYVEIPGWANRPKNHRIFLGQRQTGMLADVSKRLRYSAFPLTQKQDLENAMKFCEHCGKVEAPFMTLLFLFLTGGVALLCGYTVCRQLVRDDSPESSD